MITPSLPYAAVAPVSDRKRRLPHHRPWMLAVLACLGAMCGGAVQAADGGQLVAYPAQKYAMVVCFPRPDSETGSFSTAIAKNRWAYYDGVNHLESSFAIQVFGGAPPLQYSLITAPAGASISNVYGDRFNHGVLKWTPQAAFPTTAPASFTVRVTGQDGQHVDCSWTTATSSGTDRFVFVGAANSSRPGSDSNPGTHDQPFLTLAYVMGGTTAATTFPGRHVILYGGSYATVAQTDAWHMSSEPLPARIALERARHPIVYCAYPGQTPEIDFSGGEIALGDGNHDAYFGGSGSTYTRILKASVNAKETHNFWMNGQMDRVNFQFLSFDGFDARVAGDYTNSTPIFSSNLGGSVTRTYVGIHGCLERNRTNGRDGNDFLLMDLFRVTYATLEYCDVQGRANGGPIFKDSHVYSSARHNRVELLDASDAGGGTGWGLLFAGQSYGSDCEAFFNLVIGGDIQYGGGSGTHGAMYSARNTVFRSDSNQTDGVGAVTSGGPFTSENDVIVAKGNGSGQVTTGLTTVTGTECHFAQYSPTGVLQAGAPIDTSGSLRNVSGGTQFRTLYLGTRGWEMVVSGSPPPTNHAPVATAQSVTTAEDTARPIVLAATDADGDALTYAIATSPAHGTLTGGGANWTFTPAANYNGSDGFTFTASDGMATSVAATVSITVTAANDVPVAMAQSVSTAQDTAKAITLVGSDVEGSALTYAITAYPTHGTLLGSGANWTYTPTAGYSGSDSFAFTVNDGALTSAMATVSLTVTAGGTSGSSSGGCGAGGAAGLIIGLGLMLRLRGRRR